MNKYLTLAVMFVNTGVFAQNRTTPSITLMEAKTGKAAVLIDNNANGVYAKMIEDTTTTLFEYNYTSAQNDAISDDELKEILSFNIIPNKTGKFVLTGKTLEQSQAYFYRGCFCMDRGTHPVVGGKIKGTKMTKNSWYVNMDVQIKITTGETENIITKKVKGHFEVKN